jgi:hypothetical protein
MSVDTLEPLGKTCFSMDGTVQQIYKLMYVTSVFLSSKYTRENIRQWYRINTFWGFVVQLLE